MTNQEAGAALSIVERVARAMVGQRLGKGPYEVSDKAWMLYTMRAKAALEVSHYAELVEALRNARSTLSVATSVLSSVEAYQTSTLCDDEIENIDALLAKLEAGDIQP
jgi:hypothetical protein